jgi:hypothetical protein
MGPVISMKVCPLKGEEPFCDGAQIHVPVGEQIEEFIQPSENRGEA